MFGRNRKLPIPDEMRAWVDQSFLRLEKLLGRERMLFTTVVLANDRFFPDVYRGTPEDVETMARRVAGYMGIAPELFETHIYAEKEEAWKDLLPGWSGRTSDAAGLYLHAPDHERYTIGVHAQQLQHPQQLVATLAHELVHVLLLGGNLIDANEPDMEPFTDLTTVFLGMGVLTASVAFQFEQHSNTRTQGWSTRRTGYLNEEVWGYALAFFARARDEDPSAWQKELPPNIRVPFDRSRRWLSHL